VNCKSIFKIFAKVLIFCLFFCCLGWIWFDERLIVRERRRETKPQQNQSKSDYFEFKLHYKQSCLVRFSDESTQRMRSKAEQKLQLTKKFGSKWMPRYIRRNNSCSKSLRIWYCHEKCIRRLVNDRWTRSRFRSNSHSHDALALDRWLSNFVHKVNMGRKTITISVWFQHFNVGIVEGDERDSNLIEWLCDSSWRFWQPNSRTVRSPVRHQAKKARPMGTDVHSPPKRTVWHSIWCTKGLCSNCIPSTEQRVLNSIQTKSEISIRESEGGEESGRKADGRVLIEQRRSSRSKAIGRIESRLESHTDEVRRSRRMLIAIKIDSIWPEAMSHGWCKFGARRKWVEERLRSGNRVTRRNRSEWRVTGHASKWRYSERGRLS
jgi:hypothetical protein